MNSRNELLRLLSADGCGTLPAGQIAPEQRLYDIGFDSLRYMQFVVLLEEALGIAVPDAMLDIRADTTVEDLIRMVSASCHD